MGKSSLHPDFNLQPRCLNHRTSREIFARATHKNHAANKALLTMPIHAIHSTVDEKL